MPYRVEGSNVMHKKGGKWSVKQHCKSHAAAVRAMNLLRGVEHGWTPTEGKGHKAMSKHKTWEGSHKGYK